MTRQEFLDLYPEFSDAEPSLLDATLAQETANLRGPYVTEKLIGLCTADTLAHSPFARDLKLVNEDRESVFAKAMNREMAVAAIHRRSP